MASKWLEKDWTLTHFLYYMVQISYILTAVSVVTMTIMFIIFWQDGHPGVQVPVQVELAQFSGFDNLQFEDVKFTISENVSGTAIITGKQ